MLITVIIYFLNSLLPLIYLISDDSVKLKSLTYPQKLILTVIIISNIIVIGVFTIYSDDQYIRIISLLSLIVPIFLFMNVHPMLLKFVSSSWLLFPALLLVYYQSQDITGIKDKISALKSDNKDKISKMQDHLANTLIDKDEQIVQLQSIIQAKEQKLKPLKEDIILLTREKREINKLLELSKKKSKNDKDLIDRMNKTDKEINNILKRHKKIIESIGKQVTHYEFENRLLKEEINKLKSKLETKKEE